MRFAVPATSNVALPIPLADRIEAIDHALTVAELSQLLSWSQSLLYTRARSGRMGPAVIRDGGTVRFDPFWVAVWLRAQSG